MSIGYYHDLLGDQARIRAFEAEIEDRIGADDVVLEVGTGLGTFAQFAARTGAAHVWAVDGNPVVHVAEALVKANGLGQRITCLRGWVPDVAIPTAATVLIFEDFVTPLLDTSTYRLLRDARGKYLAPGASMIPGRATVFVAPLSSTGLRRRLFPLEGVDDRFGLDWGPATEHFRNSPRQQRMPESVLAGTPAVLYEVHFPQLPTVDEMGKTLVWSLEQGRVVHGLGLWFDLDLGAGGTVSNRPGAGAGPWGQVVLPLDPPVAVSESGMLTVSVRWDPTPDGAPGWLAWSAESGRMRVRGHEFAGPPAALEDLVPDTDAGDDAHLVLEALGETARGVAEDVAPHA